MHEKDQMIDVTKLITDVKNSKLNSSYSIAVRTEQLLENLISHGKWNTAQELMNLIKLRLKKIVDILPQEATANNIMRHILKIVRDEYDAGFKSKGEGQSTLHHLVTADADTDSTDYSKPLSSLKTALLDHLAEYKVELEASADNIASQASEHIHSNEVILTVGKSSTVEKFLKFAAKTRKYHVIVVESAPDYQVFIIYSPIAKLYICISGTCNGCFFK
ncbi:hypothetical protein AMK59_5043 [Oryctes borbonicus]|uniref:Translation initiation factor eIF2B subunit beta n=1 Tax=Oryctes borbonicus TaxID=1629725 RepID=A0A0T6B1G4_9SCAR|nr:hypothetical protein AMK59_5043 [Oryctes borbonicus]